MKESRHSGRDSCGGSAKQPPPQSSDSLQDQTLWFPTAAAHPTGAAPLGSVMSLSLPNGREGESWKPMLPVSLQGCRGTELFHHRVLPTDTAGLTLATLLPHLHPVLSRKVCTGCFIISNHTKRTGRAEIRTQKAAALCRQVLI